MAKMGITFSGFNDLIYQIDKAGKNADKAAKIALQATQKKVQQNLAAAAAPYATKGKKGYATGAMYRAMIKSARVAQNGSVFEVDVGFDLHNGGWHSIFIMYGTPRIAKDTKIYNAIKGAKTKREIAEIQEKVLRKYLAIGE